MPELAWRVRLALDLDTLEFHALVVDGAGTITDVSDPLTTEEAERVQDGDIAGLSWQEATGRRMQRKRWLPIAEAGVGVGNSTWNTRRCEEER